MYSLSKANALLKTKHVTTSQDNVCRSSGVRCATNTICKVTHLLHKMRPAQICTPILAQRLAKARSCLSASSWENHSQDFENVLATSDRAAIDGIAEITADSVRRIALKIQYDGLGFSGWEKKEGVRTVQGVIEEAAKTAFPGFERFSFHVQGSSRTDAGVHASRSVAHLEIPAVVSIDGLRVAKALQRCLPPSIVIRESAAVANDWDARRAAQWRRYRYAIHNAATPDAFLSCVAWHYPRPQLDTQKMLLAMQHLLTLSNLRSFARVERHRHLREGKADAPTKLQHVQDVQCWRDGDMVYVEIQADRFLYGQVRWPLCRRTNGGSDGQSVTKQTMGAAVPADNVVASVEAKFLNL